MLRLKYSSGTNISNNIFRIICNRNAIIKSRSMSLTAEEINFLEKEAIRTSVKMKNKSTTVGEKFKIDDDNAFSDQYLSKKGIIHNPTTAQSKISVRHPEMDQELV